MRASEPRSGAPASRTAGILTGSDRETQLLGMLAGELARAGDVLALSGPLGAGKTCLVQGVARGLDILEPVPSPTFNLLLVHNGRLPLYHFDLYRLDRADQLEDLDFYAALEAGGVSVIEWADRFPAELPDDRLDIEIEPVSESARRLAIIPRGDRASAFADDLGRAWKLAAGEAGGD